jgi:hypothetical protein
MASNQESRTEFAPDGSGLSPEDMKERELRANEPARPDGSGAFQDAKGEDAPISAWLREFFGRPEIQRFMQDTKETAEKAGVDMNRVSEVAGSAKESAQGWLERLETQAREKPLQTLAMVFGAGFLLSRVGRSRR